MVWGGTQFHGREEYVFIWNGLLIARRYRDEIVATYV